jgi:hypothetical protein
MDAEIKIVDLMGAEGNGDSVAIAYFGEMAGTIHIYRDGTVVLSSPAGTTVASLHRPDDQLWRRTQFLGMLARLGVTDQELATADQMIPGQEEALRRLGFPVAAKKVAEESVSHFQAWCQRHGLDYEQMDEPDIEQLLENALAQVRRR